MLNDATRRQNRAAAPDTSTWLSANAGSGKTRVLTDRVARLLLSGVSPQNILCLTYTKAAASEMQNRLFKRLGDWAMLADTPLLTALADIGETGLSRADDLAKARRLFASAIETPGGLRIQTIHSFCATLLRRFPLEAGVSSSFVEMDDIAAAELRQEAFETVARTKPELFQSISRLLNVSQLASFTGELRKHGGLFRHDTSMGDVLEALGEDRDLSEDVILSAVFHGSEPDLIREMVQAVRANLPKGNKFIEDLAAISLHRPNAATLEALMVQFLNKDRTARRVFPAANHKNIASILDPYLPDLHAFMDRVATAQHRRLALETAEQTCALHRFASAFLETYDGLKQTRGLLDFDDLIEKARILLSESRAAEWVLYRLDGNLEHVLIDEAQDTSPAQWRVIERLCHEFATGEGARGDARRTVFAVGDKKQSIYSFQGAEPDSFDQLRDAFEDRFQGAGEPFQKSELQYSFRSSQAILDTVDAVCEPRMPGHSLHRAYKTELPGRVDLWPLVEGGEPGEPSAWFDPVDKLADDAPPVVLARQIAQAIKQTIETETIPHKNGLRRRVAPGDFLILVRRRSALFAEIIRACKALDLSVAGADRLKLGGELAVKDLAALLAFLATPEDDLSLAAVLKSPLFGWSENDLFQLAHNRGGAFLWTRLREARERYPETLQILDDLRSQADFLRPYDLIQRVLSRHDGRRRLLARLGPEAEDGIDEFLTQALAYEQRDVPSLTGFLNLFQTDDIEVKRQMDSVGDQIRVMTVHGAKGLEAPIVILPDTVMRPRQNTDTVLALSGNVAVWKPPSARQPPAIKTDLAARRAKAEAEELRLLYVAMTRAQTWLIVAGYGNEKDSAGTWYSLVKEALADSGTELVETARGTVERFSHGAWKSGVFVDKPASSVVDPPLPRWLDTDLSAPSQTMVINPSDLGGAKALLGDAEDEGSDGKQLGSDTHVLLEHLWAKNAPDWPRLAVALIGDEDRAHRALHHARAVLTEPSFSWIFGADVLREVELTAKVGGTRIRGTADVIAVGEKMVRVVDFKTNHLVPDRPETVPDGILRQMGAYDYALGQIYPEHVIETAILWTAGPSLMQLPHEIVRRAWSGYRTS